MSKTEKGTKEHLSSAIDFRVIVLIIGLAIAHHFVSQIEMEVQGLDIFDIIDPLTMGAVAVAAFLVSRRYWGSEVFGRSYLALGIGFVCLTAGDLAYIYYENIGEDPYPSIADVFYFALYPFALIHVILNTRYFKRKFEISKKIWLIAFPVLITAIYSYLAVDTWGIYEELPFDLFYGMIFVAGAAVLLAFAVIGGAVFRHSVLGTVWLLLAFGIFIQSFADVWYYYEEIFEAYDLTHPTNTLWTFAFLLMVYALFKHRKII